MPRPQLDAAPMPGSGPVQGAPSAPYHPAAPSAGQPDRHPRPRARWRFTRPVPATSARWSACRSRNSPTCSTAPSAGVRPRPDWRCSCGFAPATRSRRRGRWSRGRRTARWWGTAATPPPACARPARCASSRRCGPRPGRRPALRDHCRPRVQPRPARAGRGLPPRRRDRARVAPTRHPAAPARRGRALHGPAWLPAVDGESGRRQPCLAGAVPPARLPADGGPDQPLEGVAAGRDHRRAAREAARAHRPPAAARRGTGGARPARLGALGAAPARAGAGRLTPPPNLPALTRRRSCRCRHSAAAARPGGPRSAARRDARSRPGRRGRRSAPGTPAGRRRSTPCW